MPPCRERLSFPPGAKVAVDPSHEVFHQSLLIRLRLRRSRGNGSITCMRSRAPNRTKGRAVPLGQRFRASAVRAHACIIRFRHSPSLVELFHDAHRSAARSCPECEAGGQDAVAFFRLSDRRGVASGSILSGREPSHRRQAFWLRPSVWHRSEARRHIRVRPAASAVFFTQETSVESRRSADGDFQSVQKKSPARGSRSRPARAWSRHGPPIVPAWDEFPYPEPTPSPCHPASIRAISRVPSVLPAMAQCDDGGPLRPEHERWRP